MNVDILLSPHFSHSILNEDDGYKSILKDPDVLNQYIPRWKPSQKFLDSIEMGRISSTPKETSTPENTSKNVELSPGKPRQDIKDLYNQVKNNPEMKKAIENRKNSAAEFWERVESQDKNKGNSQGKVETPSKQQTSSQSKTSGQQNEQPKQEEVFGALRDDGWSFEKLGKWMSENKLATGGLAAAGLLGTYYLWKKWRESKKLSEKDKEIARKLDQKSARNSGN